MREVTDRDRVVCMRKTHWNTQHEADAHAKRVENRYNKTLPKSYICPVCGSWCLSTPAEAPAADRRKKPVKRRRIRSHKTVRPYKPPPLD